MKSTGNRNTQRQQMEKAFDANQFRILGHDIIDLLADYLKRITNLQDESIPVLSDLTPEELTNDWDISKNACSLPQDIIKHFKKIITQSQHLHHPCYMGQQVTTTLPVAVFSDLVASFLNSPSAIFEMGPVHTVIELQVVNWLAQQLGYSKTAGGLLTSGGSLGNLTALLTAREIKCRYDAKVDIKKQAILFSSQTHYSETRALRIMGIEDAGALVVPVNKNYQMDVKALNDIYRSAVKKGLKPFVLIASACNTAAGTFDDLNRLADFCEKNNIWFHVDGAHGASSILSEKYRYLVEGIQRADSVVWDLHKLLMMPSLVTAVLFKKYAHSCKTFTQEAPFIYDKNEIAVDDKYIPLKRTIECTKNSMGLKFYMSLLYYRKDFFANHVTHAYDLAHEFAELIRQDSELELAVEPQSNIVCFRYLPAEHDKIDINLLQTKIRNQINKNGIFFIVKTTFDNKLFLRVSLMNPLSTSQHIKQLIEAIKQMGHIEMCSIHNKKISNAPPANKNSVVRKAKYTQS